MISWCENCRQLSSDCDCVGPKRFMMTASEFEAKRTAPDKCTRECMCVPMNGMACIKDSKEPEALNCCCDACFKSKYTCKCGHSTCLSPHGKYGAFIDKALAYYRYGLTLEAEGHGVVALLPSEFQDGDKADRDFKELSASPTARALVEGLAQSPQPRENEPTQEQVDAAIATFCTIGELAQQAKSRLRKFT